MELNEENYFSQEANLEYFSVSQIKSMLSCEHKALAELSGLFEQEEKEALLVSSFIDAYFTSKEEFDKFIQEHKETVLTAKGEFRDKYSRALNSIRRLERDKMANAYLQGEHQVIMTGEIGGAKFKIKMDSYFKDRCIVDLKAMKDFELIWDESTYSKKNFIDFYNYDLQGAVYQEIVRQNTGKKLPFIIVAVTKEKTPDIALMEIPQDKLDEALGVLNAILPHLKELKKGEASPSRCGKCDFCKETKVLTGVFDYRKILGGGDEF